MMPDFEESSVDPSIFAIPEEHKRQMALYLPTSIKPTAYLEPGELLLTYTGDNKKNYMGLNGYEAVTSFPVENVTAVFDGVAKRLTERMFASGINNTSSFFAVRVACFVRFIEEWVNSSEGFFNDTLKDTPKLTEILPTADSSRWCLRPDDESYVASFKKDIWKRYGPNPGMFQHLVNWLQEPSNESRVVSAEISTKGVTVYLGCDARIAAYHALKEGKSVPCLASLL